MLKQQIIGELRTMTKKELSSAYNIPECEANNLKYALDPFCFPIITDRNLSVDQMASCTGLGNETIRTYRSALIKAGLEDSRNDFGVPKSDRVILYIRGNPSTYEEIAQGISSDVKRVGGVVAALRRGDKARSVTVKMVRRGTNSPFRSEDLVGKLTKKSIAYLQGDEGLLGLKVAAYIPGNLTMGMRKSLTQRMRRILPKESFDVVYGCIQAKTV